MKVFLAGAAGAIGRRLIPLLRDAGHDVVGTTRSGETAAELKTRGITAVVVDVYDATALRDAVARAHPDVVIHQLTDLPKALDASQPRNFAGNMRLRVEGTANLVAAAQAAGARRLIAQSIAFSYAPGPEPHAETDPLASADGDTPAALSARGVRALEDAVLGASGLEGIVLRYGRLYGPGTWYAAPAGRGALHVDAAAQAALLAITRGRPGAYNVAEPDGALTIDKAMRDLGFDPAFRCPG
ncbi:MAG TPA: NAD(P)-dependent oxidoreductase [Xanthobacteraceae bacterium]|jgi:nucleoside-diphosphate-sugar epimerase